jgi:nitroreductase
MDIDTALLTRRTIHYWKPLPVENEAVERALQAAHMAPCHKYTWPWNFTRVGPETRSALYDLAVHIKKGDKAKLPERTLQLLVRKIQNPAALIVVSLTRCDNDFTNRENYAAVSCAIQNMSLSLHASGYGSKWSTGKVTRHEQTYSTLGIDPELEEIIGFIWIGVPESIPEAPERPSISEHVRRVK